MNPLSRRSLALVSALSLALSLTSFTARATVAGRKVLLVVQKAGPNFPVDEAVRNRLVQRGFTVDIEDQAASPALAASTDLVVISSTISGKDLHPGWRQVAKPLLTWENDVLDDLAMTGKRRDTDFGNVTRERYVWLVNAPHAMSGGLPAGVANVYVKQAGMGWGRPGLGATTIATVYGQPDKAVIFGYEAGATMDYESIAPARRVMFFLDNDTFNNLSPVGLKLFDAAIDWAAGAR